MITEAIPKTLSEMSNGDYSYSKETMVFQYALKFRWNYMSVLLTLDRKRFYLLHRQNFSSGPALEAVLQK